MTGGGVNSPEVDPTHRRVNSARKNMGPVEQKFRKKINFGGFENP
jgi:hypothetical protein